MTSGYLFNQPESASYGHPGVDEPPPEGGEGLPLPTPMGSPPRPVPGQAQGPGARG